MLLLLAASPAHAGAISALKDHCDADGIGHGTAECACLSPWASWADPRGYPIDSTNSEGSVASTTSPVDGRTSVTW